jgi:hypothetical protein
MIRGGAGNGKEVRCPIRARQRAEEIAFRRDRLLAALTLIAGAGLAISLPSRCGPERSSSCRSRRS